MIPSTQPPSTPPRGARLAALVAGAAILAFPAAAAAQNTPPAKPGFPVEIAQSGAPGGSTGQTVGSQLLVADLGLTPGYRSIVFGLLNGRLYVVIRDNSGNWVVAPGWPQQLPSDVYSSPAVGDLDGNGTPDIVVGYGSVAASGSEHGGLRAFRRDGTVLWDVPTGDVTPGPANGLRDPVMGTPAIGDVDGDGRPEVVFGALDHHLYVVNGENGFSNNAAWPKDMMDTVFSSPALHDMDGDGKLEVIIGTDYYLTSGGRLRVLRHDGTELPGFPKEIDQAVASSPAVGDIDGDGKPDIVHGTGVFFPNRLERLYAWRCDGTAVPGWPAAVTGQVSGSPALVNLDGDPALEVLVTAEKLYPLLSFPNDREYRLYGFDGNGAQLFAPAIVKDFEGFSLSAGDPVVGDVLGDAAGEILVPTNGEIAVFSAAGVLLTESDGLGNGDQPAVNFRAGFTISGAVVADLEVNGSDNKIEVLTIGAREWPTPTITQVYAWNPKNGTSTPVWGMSRRTPDRRGVAAGTASCLGACATNTAASRFYTVTPCRVVDTRTGPGPYGAPPLLSESIRSFDLTSICGVPSGARAVAVNVTVTGATSAGQLRFSPACAISAASVIHFSANQTRAAFAVVPLGAGEILYANADLATPGSSAHLILDVTGYFGP